MRIKSVDKRQCVEAAFSEKEKFHARMECRVRERYGNKCDDEALDAVRALRLYLTEPQDKIGISKSHLLAQFLNYVTQNYIANYKQPDGTFFRKLAAAMEVDLKAADPVWSFVISEILVRKPARFPTVTEMHARLQEHHHQTDRKTVERIYRALAIKRNAKRGAKLGSKQKLSIHRRS